MQVGWLSAGQLEASTCWTSGMRVSQMYGVSLLPSYSSALSGFGPKEAMATTHHMYGRGPSASLYGNTLYSSQCRCHTHALNSYASYRHANYQTTPRHTPCAHTCTVHTRFAPMRGMGPGEGSAAEATCCKRVREKRQCQQKSGVLKLPTGFHPSDLPCDCLCLHRPTCNHPSLLRLL